MITINRYFSLTIFVISFLAIGYFVANRDIYALNDTYQYYDFFRSIKEVGLHYDGRFEFGFFITTFASAYLFIEHESYFFLLFLILVLGYFLIGKEVSFNDGSQGAFLILLLISLLFSSWFKASSTNGLRQGISIVFLYISLIRLINGQRLSFLVFFVFSVSFHSSALLVIPFIVFLKLFERVKWFGFFVLSLLYPLGVYESLVQIFSSVTGIPLYSTIKQYGALIADYRNGFQLDLYIYTIGYFSIFIFVRKYMKKCSLANFDVLMKVYAALSLLYFVFGYANYSNRYGYMAWALIPVLQAYALNGLKLREEYKYILVVFLFPFSILYFINGVI